MKEKILVSGAGGFIGHHLVKYLRKKGYWVRGADLKYPEFEKTPADEFIKTDLRLYKNCFKVTCGIDHVYNLASNMGGVEYIESVRAAIMHDNLLININMLEAAKDNKIKKFFFSSSACIYPVSKQTKNKNFGLKENEAYPAYPDAEYGWEKLVSERLCKNYFLDYGLETRVARFHNIYGPLGVYQGGREKSPAAICRKIAIAKNNGPIEVWGDGRQGRSYCYIDDCLEGTYRLMMSKVREPLNIGSDRLISINQLVDIVAKIAGKKIIKKYDLTKPQGVRGRNSDNGLIKKFLKWEPSIGLEQGLKKTYKWIEKQVHKNK